MIPPRPDSIQCVECWEVIDEWVYDPEDGEWELDWAWWGKKFHCSRWCYVRGVEYRQRTEQTSAESV